MPSNKEPRLACQPFRGLKQYDEQTQYNPETLGGQESLSTAHSYPLERNNNNTSITVIDAVMGTGKSTWMTMCIKENASERYVVVLPLITELKRYETLLQGVDGVVSLHKGTKKKKRFDEAVKEASVILITHALFEAYLNGVSLEALKQEKWNLIMDEAVTAFEPIHMDHASMLGLIDLGYYKAKTINEKIELLEPDYLQAICRVDVSDTIVDKQKKNILGQSLSKDTLGVWSPTGDDRFYVFALKAERMLAFNSVMILTYPFKNTDLDYWFRIKGLKVNHCELIRTGKTNSMSDFHLSPHAGVYSGGGFKHLIESLGGNRRLTKASYGYKRNHFSATTMRNIFTEGNRDKYYISIQKEVRNNLTRIFRNKRIDVVAAEDFMFTCRKDSIPALQDSKNRLTEDFIGKNNFVPYNERATNSRSSKHYLAYIYNAYAFPAVLQIVRAYGLRYDEDRYALYWLVQWIWRSAIRNSEKIYLYIPSSRMKGILTNWLNA